MGSETWTGSAGGDWSTGSNWSAGSAPSSSTDVVINNVGYGYAASSAGVVISSNTNATANSLALNNSTLAVFGSLTAGTLTLSQYALNLFGGSVTAQAITSSPGSEGRLHGYGTLSGPISGNLYLDAEGGTLVVNGAYTSGYYARVEANSTLELGSSATFNSMVVFGGGNATLTLDYPSAFTGNITQFAISDVIDLKGIVATSVSYSGSTLTVGYGSGQTLSYNVTGQVTGNIVSAASDGHGGTNISFAAASSTRFDAAHLELAAFGRDPSAGGWNTPVRYPRAIGDVNGDGKADVIGMAEDGVFVALATGSGHFGPATFVLSGFGASTSAGGWNNDGRYPRMVADVNGDGRADIVGFGEDGGFTALGQANGTFGIPTYSLNGFGASTAAGGWNSQSKYTRMLGDVNGDGKADIVGFAEDGVFVALATGGGYFGTPTFTFAGFGASPAAGSWNDQNKYPRMLGDVNGDGKADIIGFAEAGVFISLATGDGHFGVSTFRLAEFGSSNAAGGWTSQDLLPRFVADVNGDGKADIVGLGEDGVHIAYGNGDGTFQNSVLDIVAFGHGGSAGGWSSQTDYPRFLADINGDHTADIIGLGGAGTFVGLSHLGAWG